MFKQAITESEAKELALDSYVTYVNSQSCITCGAVETWSQCFEVWLHPTKTRSSGLRNLRPITTPSLRALPMSRIVAQPKKIPVCIRCVDTYRIAGESAITRTTSADWEETLRRKYAPQVATPKVAKASEPKARRQPTLDQI